MTAQAMNKRTSWDFRESQEISMSNSYETDGFIVERADQQYLDLLKSDLKTAYLEFTQTRYKKQTSLEEAHQVVSHSESNELRLFIMQKLFQGTSFHQNYYNSAKCIIHNLCGNELAMQKRPGLSINLPKNHNDVLPIHADTWNGVSPFELNIWIPMVDCDNTMSLYILERNKYQKMLKESKGLLNLSSDRLYETLKSDLTWIPIKYGEILAFDQSLPHGYSLNSESKTHWSFNCRFKSIPRL